MRTLDAIVYSAPKSDAATTPACRYAKCIATAWDSNSTAVTRMPAAWNCCVLCAPPASAVALKSAGYVVVRR